MRKLILVVLCTFMCNILFAQTDSAHTVAKPGSAQTGDTNSMAKIYMIRSTGYVGSAVNLRALIDDVMMCKVRNNRYAVFFVQPGTHMFNATSWDKPGAPEKFGLKMPVEAGKSYYMSMIIKQKFLGIEILLEEITYNTAAPLLQKYKRDECD